MAWKTRACIFHGMGNQRLSVFATTPATLAANSVGAQPGYAHGHFFLHSLQASPPGEDFPASASLTRFSNSATVKGLWMKFRLSSRIPRWASRSAA